MVICRSKPALPPRDILAWFVHTDAQRRQRSANVQRIEGRRRRINEFNCRAKWWERQTHTVSRRDFFFQVKGRGKSPKKRKLAAHFHKLPSRKLSEEEHRKIYFSFLLFSTHFYIFHLSIFLLLLLLLLFLLPLQHHQEGKWHFQGYGGSRTTGTHFRFF